MTLRKIGDMTNDELIATLSELEAARKKVEHLDRIINYDNTGIYRGQEWIWAKQRIQAKLGERVAKGLT